MYIKQIIKVTIKARFVEDRHHTCPKGNKGDVLPLFVEFRIPQNQNGPFNYNDVKTIKIGNYLIVSETLDEELNMKNLSEFHEAFEIVTDY